MACFNRAYGTASVEYQDFLFHTRDALGFCVSPVDYIPRGKTKAILRNSFINPRMSYRDLALNGIKTGNHLPKVQTVSSFHEEIKAVAYNPKTPLEKVYLPTPCLLWKNQCIRE